ncbi:MAG TPA: shikimate dehydrogenase [Planctomycetota bacterium]|nr:shikimate dehydrogenase [Planctomycetota bacterium]HPY75373.1 shikimate dehydrogenase [Planctomycetota bacterium]HQB00986.1 shikimate dehydrogenase [Planctomycetota bacterium]
MLRFGILGWPLKYTESPLIFNSVFQKIGLEATYEVFPMHAPMQDIWDFLKQKEICGLNVTTPYKERVLEWNIQWSEEVQALGAANVIDFRTMRGYNTDGLGLIADLKQHHVTVQGANVLVLGAGGAARAAIYSLLKENAHIWLWNRTKERAETLRAMDSNKIFVVLWKNIPWKNISLILQCTSVGMKGNEGNAWAGDVPDLKGKIVYDMIYQPRETMFCTIAKLKNAQVFSGIGMLIEQARFGFEIWTGLQFPIDFVQNLSKI